MAGSGVHQYLTPTLPEYDHKRASLVYQVYTEGEPGESTPETSLLSLVVVENRQSYGNPAASLDRD